MVRETSALDERASQLMTLVAQGNQQAYADLYKLLSSRVFAFAHRMVNNAETAEEVLVDTMYDVWRTAADFRGDSKVTTWILGIARNKALMALRSTRADSSEFSEDIEEFEEVLEANVPDGFGSLAEKQANELLQHCIGKLSNAHRECIHLIHFEDLSMKEVAALQGVPEGTIKSRLSNARTLLAACVDTVQRRVGVAS